MGKSSNDGSCLQNKRWSRIELSADGFIFLKLMGKCRCVFLTLLSSACQFHRNRKHCILNTEFLHNTRHKVVR